MRMLTGILLPLFFILVAATGPFTAPVSGAISAAPTLTGPENGALLPDFGPTLSWGNPGGATQTHIQVLPANNDGPGIDVHVGCICISYNIPPPPQWYGLLPDMTY